MNQGLIFKKVIKFSQNVWQIPHSDMDTKLRKKSENHFEKDFSN